MIGMMEIERFVYMDTEKKTSLDSKTSMPKKCWMCKDKLYKRSWMKSTDLCIRCQHVLYKSVTRNNKRARDKGNKAILTVAQWGKILKASKGHCFYCKKHFGYSLVVMEHRIPISKGGETSSKNCVVSCVSCNSKKWTNEVIV
jgi:5-methylcytosine-specific restriction endonuclease McrA